jgi:predicted transcriptional regulator
LSPVRRSQFEIILGVLELIQDGEYKPTRIMRDAHITWSQFKNIIALLVEKEYVTVMDQVSGKKRRDKRTKLVYSITPKGVNVVRYYREIDKLLDETIRQPM